MEIIFKNYKYKDNNLNFTIKENEINGIITDNVEEIVDILKIKLKYTGKIIVDGETFYLFGFIDVLQPSTILDLKTLIIFSFFIIFS